jgi:hypothetical protein
VRKTHGRAAGGGPNCDGIATIACEKISRAPPPQTRNARISVPLATPRRHSACDGVANPQPCDGKNRRFARDSAMRRRVAAPGRRNPRISAPFVTPPRARCDTRRNAPRRDGRNRRIARDAAMRRRIAAASRRSQAGSRTIRRAGGAAVAVRRWAAFGTAAVSGGAARQCRPPARRLTS